MVDILCKAGQVEEAVKIVKEMEFGGCKPTSFIYSILIHTYGMYNRIEDAIDTFHEMQRSGVHGDVVIYNSLISAFCKVKRYGNTYRVLNEMDHKGVTPNSRTCNIILSSLIGEGETDEAFKVFRKMIKICDADVDTYTMMIKMFCAKKELLKARKIWKLMKEKQVIPSMHTFSVLINGICDDGDAHRACKLMEEMIEKGIRPDRETFGKLRQLLLKENRKDVLEFLHEKMDLLVKEPLCD
ncbi:unnamed protein product [Cuscuta europaea]|nr:unnamed protein product [Cuscuta europaea]